MLETWEAAPLRGATRKTHKYLLLHNYLDGSDKRTLLVGPLDSLKGSSSSVPTVACRSNASYRLKILCLAWLAAHGPNKLL